MTWSIAEGEDNGKPLYIRFRDEFQDKGADPAFPRLIQVLWKYEADEKGLPRLDVVPALKSFEARLVEALEADKLALLVAVCTHNGEREWMFYAQSVSGFQERLNALQEEQGDEPPFPIDVSSAPDPKWTAFFEDTLGDLYPAS